MNEQLQWFLLGWLLLVNGFAIAGIVESRARSSWVWSFVLVASMWNVCFGAALCVLAARGVIG